MVRVLSGAVLIACAVAVVWLAPPTLFYVVSQLVLVLGVWEYVSLSRAGGLDLPVWAAGLAAVVTSASVATGGGASTHVAAALLGVLVVLGVVSLARWEGGSGALAAASALLFPSVYLGLPIGALVAIRQRQGAAGLFLVMLTIIISDTAQYYTGRLLGRRPLAARISPKKTLEGALGGFLVGAVAFAAIGARWWTPPPPVGVRLGLGLLIVAAGIAGDLFESMLKRSAGVKDSSSLIPGHGGVLDRIDALLFAAPVYFLATVYL